MALQVAHLPGCGAARVAYKPPAMPTLADVLQAHFRAKGISAREVASRIGVSYPSLLAWSQKGGVPRKAEHRDALRRELVLQPDEFARVLAASGREVVDLPSEGPLDLRQIVLKFLYERGLTERTFADISGIPYATLIGITKRGQAPRAGTLELLAGKIGVPVDDLRAAAQRGKESEIAGGDAPTSAEVAVPAPQPGLARMVAERVAASGLSAAAFAHTNGISYIALSHLLSTGKPPEDREALEPLKAALGLDDAAFAASLERSSAAPEPSDPRDAIQAAHPLQEALLRLVKERGLTASAFAAAAGVSQLTATRLLKQGDLPARAPTHAKLRQLLGLDEAAYEDLLGRSRPAAPASAAVPEPAPEPESEPLHGLHAALRALVRERGMNQQAFAAAVDLGIQTATGLLRGELPVRQTTHAKLRSLLGLDEAAYAALLPAAAQRPARPRAAGATAAVATDEDPEVARLAHAIRELGDEQREAVWQLVKALRSKG